MFKRILKKPEASALLIGPRGTGKSTWIKTHFAGEVSYDLLDTEQALRFNRDPDLLYREARELPPGTWVVVDAMARLPGPRLLPPARRTRRRRSFSGRFSQAPVERRRHPLTRRKGAPLCLLSPGA